MTRAVFLKMEEDAVMARCAKEQVGVSAIEKLPQGGVRLVCMSSDGAQTIRTKLKSSVIAGNVIRAKHRPTRPLW
jgi:hypothetical protein